MNPQIFREYDIRGLVDIDLSHDVFVTLGKAIGTYLLTLGPRSTVVARDNRLSSPAYSAALIEGIISTGVDVFDAGQVPTPVMYYAVARMGHEAGIMVTASHNPVEYNGCKLRTATQILYGPHLQKLRVLAESGAFSRGSGTARQLDVASRYLAEVPSLVSLRRPVRVVLDAGNGTTSDIAPLLLGKAGADVIPLYCESDGRFPHHLPDPTVEEHMAGLAEKVRETGAELGIGLDGDGDRIGAVDEHGKMVWGDRLLALYAQGILPSRPSPVVFDTKCSQALIDEVARLGGSPVIWKTGYPHIKSKMEEVGALLAGEMSGHMYFADTYFGYDDGMFAALRLLEAIADHDEPFSARMSRIPEYPSTPELRLTCTDEDKFRIVDEVKRHFSDGYSVIDVDGVRVQFGDGWGLVRASNTQPILVVRFEAKTPERLREIRELFRGILSRFPEIQDLP
ncbi:MAG: phosphomannomutase/phosphoglucomutase [Candidatus Eisenbacteria bacterium]|jgi:phosphomannomutase/phosphoglucomutase|nr:phosphomannomutase/phosphoglucomutase [Candidatus Eisenbacteria bacterium]